MAIVRQVEENQRRENICEEMGLEHAWADGCEVLMTKPPKYVRKCKNCGKKQIKSDPQWQDYN